MSGCKLILTVEFAPLIRAVLVEQCKTGVDKCTFSGEKHIKARQTFSPFWTFFKPMFVQSTSTFVLREMTVTVLELTSSSLYHKIAKEIRNSNWPYAHILQSCFV
jgi:hypothetical protein